MDDEERRKCQKPVVNTKEVKKVLKDLYGIESVKSIKQLESYDDCNFYVKCNDDDMECYTLKFHNGVETDNLPLINAQDYILSSLRVSCPKPVSLKNSATTTVGLVPNTLVQDQRRRVIAVRLLTWIHGSPLSTIKTVSFDTFYKCGQFQGRLLSQMQLLTSDNDSEKLKGVASRTTHQWDIMNTGDISKFLYCLEGDIKLAVEQVLSEFETETLPILKTLRHGVIQGDFNDANIIIKNEQVAGVIDFGDIVYSAIVNDVGIALAYAILTPVGQEDPFKVISSYLAGLESEFALEVREKQVLRSVINARLAMSITLGAYSYSTQPTNEYLLLHSLPARKMLQLLLASDHDAAAL